MSVAHRTTLVVGLPLSDDMFIRTEQREAPPCGHNPDGVKFCPECGNRYAPGKTQGVLVWATDQLREAAKADDYGPTDWVEFIQQGSLSTFGDSYRRSNEWLGIALQSTGDINYNQGAGAPLTPGDFEAARETVISYLAEWGLGHLEGQVVTIMWASCG